MEKHYAKASPAKPLTLCGAKTYNVTNKIKDVTCEKCIKKYNKK